MEVRFKHCNDEDYSILAGVVVEYNSGDCNGTFEHGSQRNHCWRMTSAAMKTAHVSANGRAEPLVYLTKSELSTSFVRYVENLLFGGLMKLYKWYMFGKAIFRCIQQYTFPVELFNKCRENCMFVVKNGMFSLWVRLTGANVCFCVANSYR